MPEGDTIHRVAERLRPVLVGQRVLRLDAPMANGRPPAADARIDAVDAVGKHLLIRFADGTTLRTHMRMTGSWHLYKEGQRWRRPAHLMRARVDVDGWVAVCFAAPVVAFERSPAVGHLGPDLARRDASAEDLDVAAARLAAYARPDTEIGALLLDQRVAAGVGNVYKSEVLFACGIDPFTAVATLDEGSRRRIVATAAKLLRANLGGGPRTTVRGGLGVYGRAGRPCRRCGTLIRSARQGDPPRTTYWCPTCRPPPALSPSPGSNRPGRPLTARRRDGGTQ